MTEAGERCAEGKNYALQILPHHCLHPELGTDSIVEDSKRRAEANVAALLFPSVPPQEGEQEQRQESFN